MTPTDTATVTPTATAVATSTFTTAEISASPNPVQAGDPSGVDVSGSGFAPGEQVNVGYTPTLTDGTIANLNVTTTALSTGAILVGFLPVPANVLPGTYTITAIGSTSNIFATTNLQITAAPGTGATPTDTPVPSPTPTASAALTTTITPTPEAGPAATPTSTEVAPPTITFKVNGVKVGYGSSKLANMLHKASLSHITVGQKVKLIVYGSVSGLVGSEPVSIGFRVTDGSDTVYFKKPSDTLGPSDNGAQLGWWQFYKPASKGEERLTGTLFVNGNHRHKQIYFAVSP
jgi:hypothetical protein